MLNGDPSLPPLTNLTTEQIQKCLEENKELILAILEGHNLGKFTETAQFQAKLQHNLTYLAKLADAQPQAQARSQMSSQSVVQQGQDNMQHAHVAVPRQQQPDPSTLNMPYSMNDHHQQQKQQQQQHHLAMSLQQQDLSTSNLPFQLNDQQQQQHIMQQAFLQQQHQQLVQDPTSNFSGTITNSGIYQGSQTIHGINLSDTPESNQIGLDAGLGWSLGKSPFGRTGANTRP